ncbi:MAG: hypothetical protein EOO89_02525 [Pedobacter sp.]|nr:MAG: hypothetical protein EOO89_02525 [Pedobacter sp.]
MNEALSVFIAKQPDGLMHDFLKKAIHSFFQELNWYRLHNHDSEILHYATEATLCSLFVNGVLRKDNPRIISAVQEYSCFRNKSCNGRADLFFRIADAGIWVETKYDRDTRIPQEHWNVPEWLNHEKAYFQVLDYYESEKELVNSSYQQHYILTLCFKLYEGDREGLIATAHEKLSNAAFHSRSWYYGLGFIDQLGSKGQFGLEVYGSYELKHTKT